MATLIPSVTDLLAWSGISLAFTLLPILVACMLVRQLRWMGFDGLEKAAPE